jgi:hypothetical protein
MRSSAPRHHMPKICVMEGTGSGTPTPGALLIFHDAILSAGFRRTPVCRKPVTIFSPFRCRDLRVQPRVTHAHGKAKSVRDPRRVRAGAN